MIGESLPTEGECGIDAGDRKIQRIWRIVTMIAVFLLL